MTKKTIFTEKKFLISKLSELGISLVTLTNAEDAAKLLSQRSDSMETDALNPQHFNDYQMFLLELSQKKSK